MLALHEAAKDTGVAAVAATRLTGIARTFAAASHMPVTIIAATLACLKQAAPTPGASQAEFWHEPRKKKCVTCR
jgi:hypothetical protein